MQVVRTIQKLEITYEAGVVSYVRIFQTLTIENPALPGQFVAEADLVRADVTDLTPGEINDLTDLLGNDGFPIANRLNPITP